MDRCAARQRSRQQHSTVNCWSSCDEYNYIHIHRHFYSHGLMLSSRWAWNHQRIIVPRSCRRRDMMTAIISNVIVAYFIFNSSQKLLPSCLSSSSFCVSAVWYYWYLCRRVSSSSPIWDSNVKERITRQSHLSTQLGSFHCRPSL